MRSASKLLLRLVLPAAWSAAAPCLAAQAGAADDAVPAARMEAFLREVRKEPNTGLAAYFPRRGDWTWVQRIRDERGRRIWMGVRRFSGPETALAIGEGGPACLAFQTSGGEFGPVEGSLASHLGREGEIAPWKRVRRNRFVPPGADPGSPVFVDWRREDGEWVVAAFGDERVHYPRLPGHMDARPFSPDTALAPEDAAFIPADRQMITLGWNYVKHGNPRRLEGADRARLVRIGVVGQVSVYSEQGTHPETSDVLYLPVEPGVFQRYERRVPSCR